MVPNYILNAVNLAALLCLLLFGVWGIVIAHIKV